MNKYLEKIASKADRQGAVRRRIEAGYVPSFLATGLGANIGHTLGEMSTEFLQSARRIPLQMRVGGAIAGGVGAGMAGYITNKRLDAALRNPENKEIIEKALNTRSFDNQVLPNIAAGLGSGFVSNPQTFYSLKRGLGFGALGGMEGMTRSKQTELAYLTALDKLKEKGS